MHKGLIIHRKKSIALVLQGVGTLALLSLSGCFDSEMKWTQTTPPLVTGDPVPGDPTPEPPQESPARPLVTNLSDNMTPVKSVTWNWGCSSANCQFRYVIDTNSITHPEGSYTAGTTTSLSFVTGTYYLHVQARDELGNESEVRHVFAVLDNTPPETPSGLAVQFPLASTGNVANPVIRVGGLTSGDIVDLHHLSDCSDASLVSGQSIGTIVDLEVPPLSPGTHYFYARSRDLAGNASGCSSSSAVYLYDNIPPVVVGLENDAIPKTSKTWNWNCAEGEISCTFRYQIGTSASVLPGGAYSAVTSAVQGTGTGVYYISVQALDAAGNESSVVTVSAVLDNTPPAEPSGLTLISPATSPANNSTPVIRVSGVSTGDTVSIFSANTCSLPSFKGSALASGGFADVTSNELLPGSYTFFAQAKDKAGNVSPCSQASVSYAYDNGPTAVTGLSDDGTPRQSKSWSWGCSKGSCTYRFLVDQSYSSAPSGAYGSVQNATQSSGDGVYYLHVQAMDALGNESAVVTVSAVLDNTPPATPSELGLIGVSNPGNDPQPEIRVSGVASGDTIEVYADASCSLPSFKASATAEGSVIDLQMSLGDSGSYVFHARAKDLAGNASACSTASVSYVLDIDPPSVTGVSSQNVYTKTKTWSWGCSEPGCAFRYVIDTNATTNPSGDYSSVLSVAMDSDLSGTYYIHVQARDAAGNESEVQHAFVNLDNTRPSNPGAITGPTVDGEGNRWWKSTACTPWVNWGPSSDEHSGIDHYDVSLGTSVGATDVVTWVPHTLDGALFCGLSLTEGEQYFVNVRAADQAGNYSFTTSTSWVVDATPPLPPALVSDGDSSNSLTRSPTINWKESVDALSGIATYEVALFYGETKVKDWTPVGNVRAISFSDLSLVDNTTYVARVRARDRAGNVSAVGSGDGWQVKAHSGGGTYTFGFVGEERKFFVPEGVSTLIVKAWGGGGGGNGSGMIEDGDAYGGTYTSGTIRVVPGEELRIRVGGTGQYDSDLYPSAAGGWPDGVDVHEPDNAIGPMGGGGGSSVVYKIYNGSWVAFLAASGGDGAAHTGSGGQEFGGDFYTSAMGPLSPSSSDFPCLGNCGSANKNGLIHLEWAASIAPAGCPENFVYVPENTNYGVPDFCVAKYEMKAESSPGVLANGGKGEGFECTYSGTGFWQCSDYHSPVDTLAASRPDGTPWVNISREDASAACSNMGAGYHLITNSEWQTVARNIENVPANWSGNLENSWVGAVGVGYLNRGHSDQYSENNRSESVSSESKKPCDQTGNGNCVTRSSPDWTQNRTHRLSNGEVIWDLAGNVWEWVEGNLGFFGLSQYIAVITNTAAKLAIGPAGNFLSLNSGEFGGFGYAFSSPTYDYYDYVSRGGGFTDFSRSGIFSVFPNDWGNSGIGDGFRCAYSLSGISGSVTINGGANTTASSTVDLTLSADGPVAEMYITNTPGCADGGAWQSYSASVINWELSQASGTGTVYVKFRGTDLKESGCVSDSINIDLGP